MFVRRIFIVATQILGSALFLFCAKPLVATALPVHPLCLSWAGTYGSQALKAYCKGPTGAKIPPPASVNFGANIDVTSGSEDVAAGTGNPSIGSLGSDVLAAYDDSSAFFSACPSVKSREEFTAYSFSSNGGASYLDEGGLPNSACSTYRYFGDPSVASWKTSTGHLYFFITSLYLPVSGTGAQKLALTTCTPAGSSISCTQPHTAFSTTSCSGSPSKCDFLDKDWLTVDAPRGILYAAAQEISLNGNTKIDVEKCDIGGGAGSVGTHGGTPIAPVCFQQAAFSLNQACQNTYPSADVSAASGNVYLTWEYNWKSDVIGPAACIGQMPTIAAFELGSTLGITNGTTVSVHSLDRTSIPGYNGTMNDFPRVVVSDTSGTVTLVWNDTRFHPAGDILMQTFHQNLSNLNPVLRINSATGGFHFAPAMTRDADGDLQIVFFQRATATTTLTDVYGAFDLSPLATLTPTNVRITTGSSDWSHCPSNLTPATGDVPIADTSTEPTFGIPHWYDASPDCRPGAPEVYSSSRLVN